MLRRLACLLAIALAGCGARTGLEVGDAGCLAEPERCNGLDDDCDGVVDDGVACFFLDGEPLAPQPEDACGAEYYAYDAVDPLSANPVPDIRVSGGVVIAVQTNPACEGASLAIIADLPMDGSGGELDARFTIEPPSAARILQSDEPDECTYDGATGDGACDWRWDPCCTDGVSIGPFTRDVCVTMTLDGAMGVSAPVVFDGADRVGREYGVPFEICAVIRPPAP